MFNTPADTIQELSKSQMEKDPAKWICPIGKYRGKSYEEIVSIDPNYATWMKSIIRNEKVRDWLEVVVPTPTSIGQTRLRFGKYRGDTYDEVLAKDPSYAKFLSGIEKDDNIRAYLTEKMV